MGTYTIRLEVCGPAACFTRPEFKVERVSYECITPSAAAGLLKSIYWHPGMDWEIERIHVLEPVQFATIVRNEVRSKGSAFDMVSCYKKGVLHPGISSTERRTQRSTMYLKHVRYVIEAHPVQFDDAPPEDTLTKYVEIFKRRAQKGQCFHAGYLGCREFPIQSVHLLAPDEPIQHNPLVPDKELGLMLYGVDYEKTLKPMFFNAVLKNGVVEVEGKEVYRCS